MNLLAKRNRVGKRWRQVFFVALSAILPTLCVGIAAYSFQVKAGVNQGFLGTWRATHQGKNFMVITLNEVQGKTAGSFRMMDTHFDLEGTGQLDDISGELSEPMKLKNLKGDGKVIFFDLIEGDDPDPVHWRMELTAQGKATLRWIQLPKGFKFEPISLTKDASAR
jgi:hypothetical protein